MFQLRDQVRQQRVMNLTRGFLSFYDCMVKIDDVQALVEHVESGTRKGFYLRHLTFEFCRFHADDGTLEALQDFFRNIATKIESISFVKNHLSNTDIARLLEGAHNKELMVILPGGNVSWVDRHLILSSQFHVENLNLDFKGSSNFAELDRNMVAAIGKLQSLEKLRLDGWTMNDETFAQLVHDIRYNATLKSLHLGRIRGLTTDSLSELMKLGDYLHQQQQQNPVGKSFKKKLKGLEEIHISMIPSLFAVETRNANTENQGRQQQQQVNEDDENTTGRRFTASDFEVLFRNMNIRHVSIQESRLHQNVVKSIFRGLAQSPDDPTDTESDEKKQFFQKREQRQRPPRDSGISTFCLKAWSFTKGEFEELLSNLPKMRLSKLDVCQGGTDFSLHHAEILKALRPNVILRELELSFRGFTVNAKTHETLGNLLKRNCNLKLVNNLLEYSPSGRMDVLDKLAITQLLAEEADQAKKNPKKHRGAALDAMYLLLNHRILETALS